MQRASLHLNVSTVPDQTSLIRELFYVQGCDNHINLQTPVNTSLPGNPRGATESSWELALKTRITQRFACTNDMKSYDADRSSI